MPVSLSCMVTGSPKPALYWTHELDTELAMIMPGTRHKNMYVASDGGLKIEDPSLQNSGHYTCSALNDVGSAIARSHLVIYDSEDWLKPMKNGSENGHEKIYEFVAKQGGRQSESARLALLERTITQVKAEPLSPTSIQVTWKLILDDEISDFVHGFHVHHRYV
jgi:hypothetical protein